MTPSPQAFIGPKRGFVAKRLLPTNADGKLQPSKPHCHAALEKNQTREIPMQNQFIRSRPPAQALRNLILSAGLCGVVCLSSHVQAQVGMREIQSKGMPITLVYPTFAKTQATRLGPFEIDVALDAGLTPGRHALVVLSHGTGGSPLADHTLAATLARAGFVVAQPLHRGDNHRDTNAAGPASWQTRPKEISEAIDAVAANALWQGRVDTKRVGVHGMSAGGVSALSLAGAQWNMRSLIDHCNTRMDADIGFCLNGLGQDRLQVAKRRAQYLLGGVTPNFMQPAYLSELHGGLAKGNNNERRPDTRIAAASLLVPLVAPFTAESLQAINIPVGVVSAGQDQLLVPQFHSDYLLSQCTRCEGLAQVQLSGHFDWLSPWPDAIAQQVGALQMRGGYPTAGFSAAQRQNGFDAIASFFQQHLSH
jgi:predicted dienelactone hydrolase